MSTNETFGPYTIVNKTSNSIIVCFHRPQSHSTSNWQVVNPLTSSLPLFLMQLCLIIFTHRLLTLILKPLRQPRIVADIMSGILMGASVMELVPQLASKMYPFESNLVLETMANIGLMYYMFLVGLEMDLTPIRHIGIKALSISIAGILPPMGLGVGLYLLIQVKSSTAPMYGAAFWAIALTVTSFPDLARLLSDFKLMQTDLGRTALTAAIVNDIVSWALLVGAVTVINGHTFYMLLPTIVFIAICWFVLRPAVNWFIMQSAALKSLSSTETGSHGKYSDVHVHFVIAAVAVFGFITDICGSNSMIGAFMFGLIIPSGELGTMVMERVEEYVTGILLPAFFLSNGLRNNVRFLFKIKTISVVVPTIVLACFTKVVSTMFVSSFFGIKISDGFALGVLMNTKGVLALIVLNFGRNIKAFDQITFSAMMVAYLIMTFSVGPIISFAYKPGKRFRQHKHTNLQKSKPNSELRVMTCVHSIRNVSSMIKLLQISNPSKKSPLSVFGVNLVELTGRNAAMLIVHDTLKSGANNPSREKATDNQIITAFESFESDYTEGVSVQPLTVVSSYASMHGDIINYAEEKSVGLIIVPFHKRPTPGGTLEDDNPSIREVNQNLMATSPCSVAIFVDCGLRSITNEETRHGKQHLRVVMIFVGGSDDREALAYAWRMAETRGVNLTVVRFLPSKDAVDIMSDNQDLRSDDGTGMLMAGTEIEKQQRLDDAYINQFRFRSMNNESITYVEKLVTSGEQTVEAINSCYNDFDLYIVGRGHGRISALTSGLTEWNECPELGEIGDVLVQADLASLASVLVVQQGAAGGHMMPLGSPYDGEKFSHTHWRPLAKPEFEAFVNHRKNDDLDGY
ncbi:Na_H_Exchanger domain-containing protein [Cephalotus follicularis]|uniref:Na_H_Exchanger domain-containing protein n=1 Tax=Cephalotus follicularis TaxID=3775 RepID=A0A1Q3C2V4_CEPFO|nr:Na_H_Exchanger domain-containing protein [Cephalotus follicularis]